MQPFKPKHQQTQVIKRVLVLDACQRSALAVVRSLGKHGLFVITADESDRALAGQSRYSQNYYAHPSARHQPAAFLEHIKQLCEQHEIGMVIPMTELTATLLLQCTELPDSVILPFADADKVDMLADKTRLIALAQQLGIKAPDTRTITDRHTLLEELEQLDYPLVLKPGKSWIEQQGKWHHTTVRIAASPDEARQVLLQDPSFTSHPFMLQDYLPGSGGGLFALYDRGRAIAFFAHKRLREKPPRGGVSVLSESAPLDETLLRHAQRLLDQAQWHGVAMVEFRITPDGTPYLMEVNTRFWGSLQLAINAGIDFPWLLYQISCNQQIEPVTSYRTGIRLRWCLGNLDWLYLVLRDASYSTGDKLKALLGFMTPSPFRTRLEVLRCTDIRPFIWECKQYLRDLRH